MNHSPALNLRPRNNPSQCLVCHEEFPKSEDQLQCPRCNTSVHRECAGDGQCQVLGCSGKISLDGSAKDEEFKTSTAWPLIESCLFVLLILAIVIALLDLALKYSVKWTLPGLVVIGIVNLLVWTYYNIAQSLLLFQAIRNREDLPSTNRKIAIQGPIDTNGKELIAPNGKACAYYLIEHQNYNTGRHKGWYTNRSEEFCLPFRILGVLVPNDPSELYGLDEWTSTEDPNDQQRTCIYSLPLDKEVTALGLFQSDPQKPQLINDNGVGLVISALNPSKTANQELLKALIQLSIAAFATWLLSNYFKN